VGRGPIGDDATGGKYFFFSYGSENCRLYRVEPLSKGANRKSDYEETSWETVCASVADISTFLAQLSSSRSTPEQRLAEVLSADILPRLIETSSARRRAGEKAAGLEGAPRKRSSQVQVQPCFVRNTAIGCCGQSLTFSSAGEGGRLLHRHILSL
jgi:hypothetical protein